jgi:hypothetical protein
MADIPIAQALYLREGTQTPRLLARSPDFRDDWLPEAERLTVGFGERPAEVLCPRAVFARPLGKDQVIIVQAADQARENPERPVILGFHLLVVPRLAYTQLLGDPFLVADRYPPNWSARGELPGLTWPEGEPLPPRTVEEVRQVLQRTKSHALREDEEPTTQTDEEDRSEQNSESPALLGGVQVLVDGGRVVFERPAADPGLMRGLWTLLPDRTRCELWPASYAFSNALGFDALVVPRLTEDCAGYTTEDQAAEYPAGNYELNLQIAAEAGDQAELNALFARRSWSDMWRLGLTLLVIVSVLVFGSRFLEGPEPEGRRPATRGERQAVIAAGLIGTNAGLIGLPTGSIGISHPLNSITLLPAAYDTWNLIHREKQ